MVHVSWPAKGQRSAENYEMTYLEMAFQCKVWDLGLSCFVLKLLQHGVLFVMPGSSMERLEEEELKLNCASSFCGVLVS